MEDPLLIKSSEHIVDIKTDGDSSSTEAQTPQDQPQDVQSTGPPCTKKVVWNIIEFVLTLVQIVAAIVVLTRAKDEQPEAILFIWIIAYTCISIAYLPILCWHFWCYNHRSIITTSETRSNKKMDDLKTFLEFFFVGWFVLFLWVYLSGSSPMPLDDTTQHFWLCMAFLAFCLIRYVGMNMLCAATCFFLPAILVAEAFSAIFIFIFKILCGLFFAITSCCS